MPHKLSLLDDLKDISGAVKNEETGWEIGSYSLPTILLKYLRLSDGHQLIMEIHQAKELMAPVQAVIPTTPKAEWMIIRISFPMWGLF
jgi:hypothetical protein